MTPLIEHVESRLADFTMDRRVLQLSLMAAVAGVLSALAAAVLVWFINVVTNLAYYQRLSALPATPPQYGLGAWSVLVPVVGGLIIGLMARYGSPKIRGHGIPEALEAILMMRSRIEPKVAFRKPVSQTISIRTTGP